MIYDLINILETVKKKISDSSVMMWVSNDTPKQLREEIQKYINELTAGNFQSLEIINTHFLPTCTFQEHSILNDWADEYLRLSEKFDLIYSSLKNPNYHCTIMQKPNNKELDSDQGVNSPPQGNGGFIFVTGGAGLVGAALLKQLLAQNKGPIKALYRNNLPPSLTQEEIKKIEWVQGDVLNTSLLYEAMKDCKQVYHSAAIVSYHKNRRQQMYKINIEGTANMVNAALENKVEKFVHVSSVAAIGRIRKGAEPITEETKWSEETNNSHYGTTKYQSELEVWRAVSEGLNAVIVNPSIILGEASWETGSASIFKNVWNEFPWYTNGGTGFVDSIDVANAMILLMESTITAERFLLSNEHFTFRELFTKIAIEFGKKPPHREAKKWMGELVWRLEHIKSLITKKEPLLTKETTGKAHATTFFSNEKLLHALPGFQFTPADITIKRTCKWLKEYYKLS